MKDVGNAIPSAPLVLLGTAEAVLLAASNSLSLTPWLEMFKLRLLFELLLLLLSSQRLEGLHVMGEPSSSDSSQSSLCIVPPAKHYHSRQVRVQKPLVLVSLTLLSVRSPPEPLTRAYAHSRSSTAATAAGKEAKKILEVPLTRSTIITAVVVVVLVGCRISEREL